MIGVGGCGEVMAVWAGQVAGLSLGKLVRSSIEMAVDGCGKRRNDCGKRGEVTAICGILFLRNMYRYSR